MLKTKPTNLNSPKVLVLHLLLLFTVPLSLKLSAQEEEMAETLFERMAKILSYCQVDVTLAPDGDHSFYLEKCSFKSSSSPYKNLTLQTQSNDNVADEIN